MANFTVTTLDSAYTYSSRNNTPASIKQKLVNNNKYSDTQGFLVKAQVGRHRAELMIEIDDTKDNIETNLLPMLTYPVNMTVTIDRNIIGKNSKTSEFVIRGWDIEELGGSDSNTADQIVKIKFVEVIDS